MLGYRLGDHVPVSYTHLSVTFPRMEDKLLYQAIRYNMDVLLSRLHSLLADVRNWIHGLDYAFMELDYIFELY